MGNVGSGMAIEGPTVVQLRAATRDRMTLEQAIIGGVSKVGSGGSAGDGCWSGG